MKQICLLILALLKFHIAFAQLLSSPAPKDAVVYFSKEELVKDLDEYKHSIATLHVHPFDYIDKNDFFDEINELKKNAHKYDTEQLLIKLKKINAKLQDEHTNIFYTPNDEFPLRCYWFEEGIYITGTSRENRQFLFSKIIAINNIPIKDIIDSISTILPDKNQAALMANVPHYIIDPFVLHGLGISPFRTVATYTIVGKNNDTICMHQQIQKSEHVNIQWGIDKQCNLRNAQKGRYWYKHIDDGNANFIYFKYAKCHNDNEYPFRDMEEQLIRDIEQNYPDKIIIDLRDNGGGKARLLGHFINYLSKSGMNRKGKIYVLVGRKTFSAAVVNAVDLKTYTFAKIVGEETAGSVAHYGAIDDFFLPFTKLRVMYSTKYIITDEDYEGSLRPDILIPERFSDHISGYDAALQYAIDN